METLYDAKFFENDDGSFCCRVDPIRVIRRGILPGCSAESITAIGVDGRQFLSSPENYFTTEAKAWASIRKDILEGIKDSKETLEEIRLNISQLEKTLSQIPSA